MKKTVFYLLSLSLIFLFYSCGQKYTEELVCLQITDRSNSSKTIARQDRLKNFQKIDFSSPQPYKQVVRIYQPKGQMQKLSKITSYHPNGNLRQYLEAQDSRACGKYLEYYPGGQLAMEARVIGGPASLAPEDQKKWLFDGESTAYDEEGRMLGHFFYEKGSLEKTGTYYYTSGKKKKSVPYLYNQIHGNLLEYFENGKIKTKSSYRQNQKQGNSYGYFENGKISFLETYDKNRLVRGDYFNENQELVSFVQNGDGIKSLCRKDRVQKQIQYQDGLPDGFVKNFSSEGKLIHLFHQKDGKKEGEEVEYYSNGLFKMSLQWVDDQIQGEVKTWYENGQLSSSSQWQGNKKNGSSISFYEDGNLMLMEEYENDLLKKGRYYKKGEKKAASYIKEGNGEATLFDKEGNFLKKIEYVQGKPNFYE